MNVKSSYGSSFGSLSSGSAIVNMDESQRVQMPEPAEDTSLSPGMAHEQVQRLDEVLPDKLKDASHVEDMQVCGQLPNVTGNNILNCDLSSVGGNGNPKNSDSMEGSRREAAMNCEGSTSAAGSQLSEPENGGNSNSNELNAAKFVESIQLNSKAQSVELHRLLENSADTLQKLRASSQDGLACMVNMEDTKTPSTSSWEKAPSSAVVLFPDSIKPKDVMNAVGQRLFWKARKAILRQQEIFSNQVFELHKLIEVQKLLAKVPNMLFDEHMLLGRGSDKVSGDDLPNEGIPDEQQENLDSGKAAPPVAHQSCGRQQPHGSKHTQGKTGAGEGQDVAAVLTNASFPLVLPSTPFGQPCHSLSSDGVSAWGYPMGPLNRPFLLSPSGPSSLPSGTPFGGAYVVGVNPPMAAPYTYPCYGRRPEQTLLPGPSNPWPPAAMYHNPYRLPMMNDWLAPNNYQGRAPLGSGSDRAGPASSAPSINTRVEASAHNMQPAVAPSVRQQLGSSRLMGTTSHGSATAAASTSTPVKVLSRRASAGEEGRRSSPGSGGGGRMAAEGWGACEGERRAGANASEWPRKGGGQLPAIGGMKADGREVGSALGSSALNLFPLQPSRSSGEGRVCRNADGQGRVIKAIPRSALAASESAAGILLSIQKERQL